MSPVILTLLRFGLDIALKVTVLLVAAEVALLLLRRAPAALRHSVSTFALIGALALPVAALLVPRWQFPVVPSLLPEKAETAARPTFPVGAASAAVRPDSSLERSKMGLDVDELPPPARVSGTAASRAKASSSAISRRTPLSFPPAPAVPQPRAPRAWMTWALLAWALGAALALARLISGSARVRAIARDAVRVWDLDWTLAKEDLCARLGIDRPVALLASERVPVAMTAGLRRPILLLAASAERWPAERRRVVLLHELAHVERRDWIALLIAEVVRALYWFHPLVWAVVGQARRDCEKACDDIVLESGTKPSVYAAHLLGIVRSLQASRQRLLPAVPMARPSQFEGRMRAILDAGRARRRISAFEKGLAVAGILGVALAVAAVEPWAKCPQQRTAFFRRMEAAPISAVLGFVPVVAEELREQSPRSSPRRPSEAPGLAPAVYPGGPAGSNPAAAPIKAKAPCKGTRPAGSEGVEGAPSEGVPAGVVAGVARNLLDAVAENVTASVAEGVREGVSEGVAEAVPAAPSAPKVELAGFRKVSHRDDRSGGEWYARAMKLHNRGHYEEAIEAFQKSIDLGYREATSSYNIACGYARLNKSAEAMEWLRRAEDAGFDLEGYIHRDDDLDSLRKLPEFQKLAHSFKNGKAAAAERRLARISENPSTRGETFYSTGKDLLNAESFDAAAQAFQKSANAGYRVGASLYNEACSLARGEKTKEALELLEKALLAGFDDANLVRKDDDLDNIRSEKRYDELERLAEDLSLSLPKGDWNVLGYGKHQWRKAVSHYRDVAQAHPQIGRAWFNLGYAAIRSSEYDEATRALDRALALGYRKPTTMYNLACSYALRGEGDKAFDWLNQSLDAGFDGRNMDDDHDLDALHGDARFQKALDKAERIRVAEKD